MAEFDKERAIYLLNRILESELVGVVRYTHYSFLVFGHCSATIGFRSCRGCPNKPRNRRPMLSKPER
jgi:hypothetical protein